MLSVRDYFSLKELTKYDGEKKSPFVTTVNGHYKTYLLLRRWLWSSKQKIRKIIHSSLPH